MAVDERLEEFVSEKGWQDWERLHKEADQFVKEMDSASKAAKKAFDGLGSSKTLNDLVSNTKAAEEANKTLSRSTLQYITTLTAAEQVKAKYNGSSEKMVSLSQNLAKTMKYEATASKLSADSRLKNAEAAKIEAQYTALLTKEKERLEKAAEKERISSEKLGNAYEVMKKQYKTAADEAKRLGAEFGVNDERAKAASASAMKLYSSLLAVEKSVGQAQRQVGQYNTATMAMSQLLREAPSFAYSFSTGLLGISNNIPILIDEITKLKAANVELVAAGSKAIPIWKTLGSALFSFNGIATIALAAVTIIGARMGFASDTAERLSTSFQRLTDYYKQFSKAQQDAAQTAGKEKATMEVLYATTQNLNIAYKDRELAVKKLQELYPDYFGNLSKEKILAGEATDQYNKLAEAIERSAKIKGIENVLGQVETDLLAKRDRLAKLQGTGKYELGKSNTLYLNKSPLETEYEVSKLKNDLAFLEEKKKMLLAGVDAPSSADQKVSKSNASNGNGSIAATLDGNKQLIAAQYELKKQQVAQEAEILKAVYENEKNNLDRRFEANLKYQAKLHELLSLEAQKQYELEDENISNSIKKQEALESRIAGLKKGEGNYSAKYRSDLISNLEKQVDNENTIIEAAEVRKQAIYEKAQLEHKKILEKGNKENIAILKSGNEEWIRQNEEAFAQMKTLQETGFVEEVQQLVNALHSKEITQEQFYRRLKALQDKERIILLNAEIERDKALLNNDQLTADQRLTIRDRLNKSMESLANTTAGTGKGKKSNNPFGLADEDYNNAVKISSSIIDLNNAIVSSLDARYQREIDAIDRKQEKVKEAAAAEIQAIQNSALSEDQKAKKIKSINAQLAQQERNFERQKIDAKRKQAQADRAAAIASIIQSTSVAVVAALGMKPWTPLNFLLAGSVGAVGLVNLAKAASTEIPQYAEGTEDHPGGKALVGEKYKPELVIEPGKKPYFISKPTVKDFAKHTRVIPEHKLASDSMGFGIPSDVMQHLIMNNSYSMDTEKLVAELADIKNTIANKQEVHFRWDNGELRKSVKKGNTWMHYLNQNNGRA